MGWLAEALRAGLDAWFTVQPIGSCADQATIPVRYLHLSIAPCGAGNSCMG
jgi:hypothetical protein